MKWLKGILKDTSGIAIVFGGIPILFACKLLTKGTRKINKMVVVAQLVERWIVIPEVAGSSPVSHPEGK